MNKIRISVISDTHTKHDELNFDPSDLPGGSLLIHAGDIMNSGRNSLDISRFTEWFDKQPYMHKVFIAGNHDRLFETDPEMTNKMLSEYKDIIYLQDSEVVIEGSKIYGSPWQPWFYDWAFNLPKGGPGLMSKWEAIPKDTDILVTHGPPQDHLDISGPPYNEPHLGCALLREKVDEQPPKIHVFGHIHGSYGYKFHNGTHFFNASILNERYEYKNKPITFDWNSETNEITFI